MVNNGVWSAVRLLYTDSMLNGKIAFIRELLPKKPYLYGFEKSLQLLNLIFVYMNLLPVFFFLLSFQVKPRTLSLWQLILQPACDIHPQSLRSQWVSEKHDKHWHHKGALGLCSLPFV